MMRIISLAVIMLALTGPIAGQDCHLSSPSVARVLQVAKGIIAADNSRDLEKVLGFYTADAVLMPANEAPVKGRKAIRPRYEALFSQFQPEIEPRVDEACVSGNLAFVRGHNGGRLVASDDKASRALDDGYLMILKRDTKGIWRISQLMWHRQSHSDSP